MKKSILILFSVLFAVNVFAQENTMPVNKKIIITKDTISFDTLSIVPGSLVLKTFKNRILKSDDYKVNYKTAQLVINSKKFDSISISYNKLNVNLSKPYNHKKYDSIKLSEKSILPLKYEVKDKHRNDFFTSSEINKSGSISRGISLGNNSDASVNSDMNLQLSGKINNEISVVAAITDDNIPIQPDGTSQNLREFDKVYIKAYNKNNSITAGDFEIKSPTGYFLKMNKKVQGGKIETTQIFNNKSYIKSIKSSVSGAVSKGKYNKVKFQGQESNQGPYKLAGSNNETYIVVLSGSEKVYIDGELMVRGAEFDYTINYNTAEITFTAKQLINRDKEITVEYEYSNRNYVRFSSFSENKVNTSSGNFFVNYFIESDAKNQPIRQELSENNKILLREIGDSIQNAFVSSAVEVDTFSNSEILYKKVDTIINGNFFNSIFVYSTNEFNAKYRVSFSYLGENRGNYKRVQNAANGRVFEWVAPVNNIPQGDYEPVTLLVAPKSKQILTFGGQNKITESTNIGFEIALSDNDINKFSEKDSENNKGYAGRFSFEQNVFLADTNNLKLKFSADYSFINENFSAVDRYRDVDFRKHWNLSGNKSLTNEHLLNANVIFYKQKIINTGYSFDMYRKEGTYSAIKNSFEATTDLKRVTFQGSIDNMQSEDLLNKTNYTKHLINLSKDFKFFKSGVKNKGEVNIWKQNATGDLIEAAKTFNETEIYIKNSDSTKTPFEANYKRRIDYWPKDNKVSPISHSDNFTIGANFNKNRKRAVRTSITYRNLQISDTSLTEEHSQKSLTGQLALLLNVKKAISLTTFIEHGSGLEPRQEYSYLEVPAGQGLFTWKDFNNNNIKELNEFIKAVYSDEANFLRVLLQSNNYESVYNQTFNQSINLNPKRIWKKKRGVFKFLSKFSNRLNFRYNRKIKSNEDYYKLNIADSGIMNFGLILRNNLSFKAFSGKTRFDYIYKNSKNKVTSINGADNHSEKLNAFSIKQYIKSIILTNKSTLGTRDYLSSFFTDNNYEISYIKNITTLNYSINKSINFILNLEADKKDNLLSYEKMNSVDIGSEIQYGKAGSGMFSLKINFINIDFDGNTNSSIAYKMLESLQPGKNYVWSAVWQKSLSEFLQLSVNYQGRKSNESKIIHFGGLQLRALF